MWRCQESVTSQAHYGRIFGWGGGVWGEGSENQHAAVSCGALHFQHGKSSGGCHGNKSQISTERTPLCSTPPYHPCSRLLPPPVTLLLPGHLSADRELRPQTGLLRGAGIRLRPGIMSKAPLSIPEQEHVPADTGAQQTVFPLLLPLRLYSIAAIYFVLKPLRRWFVSIVC